jgi:hypothetical protein
LPTGAKGGPGAAGRRPILDSRAPVPVCKRLRSYADRRAAAGLGPGNATPRANLPAVTPFARMPIPRAAARDLSVFVRSGICWLRPAAPA